MQARAKGVVTSFESERPGIQEIRVSVDGSERRAVNYPCLTGVVSIGDEVLLNTWAVSLGLGSGGVDFVIASNGSKGAVEPPGHIMKLRYTPLQFPVLAAAAPESPLHEDIAQFRSLEGTPVVCAELHSQIPAIAAAIKWETHDKARVAYLMTDGAALPISFSRAVSELRERNLVDSTVTAGQAFGGDYEAVNLYSGLAAARAAAKADAIIVCQGPGGAGTATPLGFSGIDQGIALNAAIALGGTPIAVVRISFCDARPRHQGISHHTLTVLERIVLGQAIVPIPRLRRSTYWRLMSVLEEVGLRDRHEFVTVDAELCLKAIEQTGIPLETMGRGIADERAFFLSAVAAGLLAGQSIIRPKADSNL